jgi:hypothetical protein
VGLYSSISGANVAYAGGGGGSLDGRITGGKTVGTGGAGGGGTAVYGSGATPNPGVANTGGGGGGNYFDSSLNNGPGGNGGSGVVILRYSDSFANASTTGSPQLTISGGYRIYRFTGDGSITF